MALDKARIAGLVGFWAFLLGLFISLVAGAFLPANGIIVLVLVILGIVIGFLNITPKETQGLLLAAIALIVVGNAFGALTFFDINKYIGGILVYITVFVSPAAVIAAIKTLWAIGKPGD
jgi:predicted S18 family serine protease